MLRENQAQGHPLTKAQKGYFGVIASGKKSRKSSRKFTPGTTKF